MLYGVDAKTIHEANLKQTIEPFYISQMPVLSDSLNPSDDSTFKGAIKAFQPLIEIGKGSDPDFHDEIVNYILHRRPGVS